MAAHSVVADHHHPCRMTIATTIAMFTGRIANTDMGIMVEVLMYPAARLRRWIDEVAKFARTYNLYISNHKFLILKK